MSIKHKKITSLVDDPNYDVSKDEWNQEHDFDMDGINISHADLDDLDYASAGHTGFQPALGYTPENVANLRTSFQAIPDNIHYPSEKLVKDNLDVKTDKIVPSDMYNFAGLNAIGNLIDTGLNSHKIITKTVLKVNLITGSDTNKYLKIDYFMFTENNKSAPEYTKVYKDGVEMVYGVGWAWGALVIGNDDTMRDNIRIIDLTGTTYSLEYTERYSLYEPLLRFWDTDDRRNKIITSKILDGGTMKHITSVTEIGQYEYDAVYQDRTIAKTFSKYTKLSEYPVNFNLSALGWRIELYKAGNVNSHSGQGSLSPGHNSNLNPYRSYQANLIINPGYRGSYHVRLRNINTNIVTNFSKRYISVRRYGVWKREAALDTYIGHYTMLKLV
jgi:hypothetical protein